MVNNFLSRVKIKIWLAYVGLIFIIVCPWFFQRGYLLFTDMAWGPHMALPHWTSSWFSLILLVKGLGFLLPIDLIEKLFIGAVLAIILWGGYKMARVLTANKAILFLGSAFALFNPFVYDRLMYGQVGMLLGFGFLLAAFSYLLNSYTAVSKKGPIVFAGVCSGLSLLFVPQFIFFFAPIFLVFLIFILTKDKKLLIWSEIRRVSGYFLLSAFIVAALNWQWFYKAMAPNLNLPNVSQEEISLKDLEAFKVAGKNWPNAVENIFLMSGFWGAQQHRYENLQNIQNNWGRSFYLLLPVMIWGLGANLRDKRKRTVAIVLLLVWFVFFILALGVALPFTAKIIFWLFNNVPFYKTLREPQKLVAIIVAVYEVFLVTGFVALSKKGLIIKNRRLAVVLVFLIILWQAPLLVWGAGHQLKPTDYPADWYEINELIQAESAESGKCQSKILFLPWHLYLSFNWTGKVIANPSPNFFQCPVVYGQNIEFAGIFGKSPIQAEREVEKWVLFFGRNNALQENKLNIGYIILAKEVDWRDYFWIANHPNAEFLKETENLMLYRVKKYEPR